MKQTPMVDQYLSIKNRYKDSILFYRMGDFYEMFFDDAKIASKALEIALTSRNKNDKDAVPMCGVPYRAAQGYIAKLVKKGFKVAICDQTQDSSEANGLVKREVTRVITPGMIVESEFLDESQNNFLAALCIKDKKIGLSILDISTAEFKTAESDDINLITDEILRIAPSEILLPLSYKESYEFASIKKAFEDKTITYLDDSVFDYRQARESLLQRFKTVSLEGFGCESLKAAVASAGAIIHYGSETQKQALRHFNKIETYSLGSYLIVDETSSRNLELLTNIRTGSKQGTLLSVLDHTQTSMGRRLLRQWIRYPLKDFVAINQRLDAVGEMLDQSIRCMEIKENLQSVYDLQRLAAKISMGHASPRDLVALKQSLNRLPAIKELISDLKSNLFEWDKDIDALSGIADMIENSIREDAPLFINEGQIIKPGYDKDLDELIQISQNSKNSLAALEIKEKKAADISSLKVRYNKVFGYYIEVPKAKAENVPAHYIRRQTLTNAERYITDELKDFESKVLGAQEKRVTLELRLFKEIRENIAEKNSYIQKAGDFIAHLDCITSFATAALKNDYCRPQINDTGQIKIEEGRHPVIEKMIKAERFVPNDIEMDNSTNQVLIITGPNMAGKSTVLRQTALTVIMAQMGAFTPAKSASISISDRIFTRVGALDNLSGGQSTFLVEMQETANILNCATRDSLVVMDEIGRGTSTFDGLSIAWAVAEALCTLRGKGVKTLFATHYHELTKLEESFKRVKNFNIAVKEAGDEIVFLRKLVKGGTSRSYGIQVASLAGIPDTVIKRAKEVLYDIENSDKTKNIDSSTKETQKQEPQKIEANRQTTKKGAAQMELFSKPSYENEIIKTLKEIDIAGITPLDALNILDSLKKKL